MIWVFLVITFGTGEFENYQSIIPLRSQDGCEEMSEIVMRELQPVFPDVMTQCVTMGEKASIRPKRRPW